MSKKLSKCSAAFDYIENTLIVLPAASGEITIFSSNKCYCNSKCKCKCKCNLYFNIFCNYRNHKENVKSNNK